MKYDANISPKTELYDCFGLNLEKNKNKILNYLHTMSSEFELESINRKIEETINIFQDKYSEEKDGIKLKDCSKSYHNLEKYFEEFMKTLLKVEQIKK